MNKIFAVKTQTAKYEKLVGIEKQLLIIGRLMQSKKNTMVAPFVLPAKMVMLFCKKKPPLK